MLLDGFLQTAARRRPDELRQGQSLVAPALEQFYGLSIPTIGPGGDIYVVTERRCRSNGLTAISPNGEQRWSFSEGGFDWVGISSDGSIIVGASNQVLPGQCCKQGGYVYAFNSQGERLWTFERENERFLGFAIDAQGTIFVPSEINNTSSSQVTRVYAIQNGIEQWSIDIPGTVASFPGHPAIGASGRLYLPFVVELADYGQQRQLRLYAFGSTPQSTASGGANLLKVVAKTVPSGDIVFSVSEATVFEVEVFSLAGSKIYSSGLVVGRSFSWSGLRNDGHRVANGVYLYVLTMRMPDGRLLRSEVKKLVILR